MKKEFFYPSKDGKTQIHAIEWIPEGEVTTVLQVCHGMVEYIDRYDEFAAFLASQGVYVVGHDHLGHGLSVTNEEKLGYFHETNGNDIVIADIHALRKITQEKYPTLPYYMMGHSMGSFLVRQYLGTYSEGVAGAVIMGTGNQPTAIVMGGMLVCKLIALCKGWEYRSDFVNNLAVGGYFKKMGLTWLSKNVENQEKYLEDPLCGYVFTLNAYYNMFKGIYRMKQQEKAGNALKSLPMFFVSGAEDPVGGSGKGVETVAAGYTSRGQESVTVKLYQDDTHEILNELDRQVVFQDILDFIKG